MAEIIFNFPAITEPVTLEVNNQKLIEFALYYCVSVNNYPTQEEAVHALIDAIIKHLKRPIIQGRSSEAVLNINTDDLIL